MFWVVKSPSDSRGKVTVWSEEAYERLIPS